MFKFILLLSIILGSSIYTHAKPRVRPSTWASPVIEAKLKKFYKVSPKVYRSEQPSSKAFAEIQALGITDVLNLRNHHTDNDEAEGKRLKLHAVKMNAGSITPEQVLQSLAIIKKSKGPIVIHCWHGSDRTGTIVAAYRMVFQKWPKEKAIDEFKNGGYGYHSRIYPNLIKLLKSLDIEKLQNKLGIQRESVLLLVISMAFVLNMARHTNINRIRKYPNRILP
jgi:tyrosine-protein phosphatase SIW14